MALRLERALDALALLHPRALAYAICDLYNSLQRYDGTALVRRKLLECAEPLVVWYELLLAETCHDEYFDFIGNQG